jgi:integrase
MRGDGRLFRKPGSRVWHMQYSVQGQRVRCSTGKTDYAQARQVLRERVAEVVRGDAIPHERQLTVAEMLDALWADYEVNGRKWLRTVKYPMRHVADHFGEKTKAVTVTTDRIQDYVRLRQQDGAAPATVNHELAILNRAFVLAVRARRLRAAPFIPKLPADPSRVRQGFFSREEVEALCRLLPADVADAVSFLFFSAWRVGELRTLEWRDFDRHDRVIRLRGEHSKTKHGRVLPVAGEIGKVMERRVAARRLDCPFMFHRDGKPLGDFRKLWTKACKQLGLEGRIVHDLRRSGVKHLIAAGIDPHTVMAFSGHRTASMLRRYHIINVDDLRRASERASAYQSPGGRVVALGAADEKSPRTAPGGRRD